MEKVQPKDWIPLIKPYTKPSVARSLRQVADTLLPLLALFYLAHKALSVSLLLALALVFGLFYGVYLAVDWALVADVLKDPEAHATDMGLWQTAIVVPQVLAGAFGRPLDLLNAQTPGLGYQVLYLLAALFFLLGAFGVAGVRRSR